MSSEEKAAESDGESPSGSRALSRKPFAFWLVTATVILALMQFYFWGHLFSGTRPASLDTLNTAVPAVIAFAAIAQATYVTASVARISYSSICGVTAVGVYTFLLITVQFATLYWTIGTTANFNVELSRIDAIYFALGTLTTAGTGTIAPTSDLARALVSGQMVLDLVFVAGAVTIVVTRWSEKSS